MTSSQQAIRSALKNKANEFIANAGKWNADATKQEDKELRAYCTMRALLCLKTSELYLDTAEAIK